MANAAKLAEEFKTWCNSFGPSFHNSPDIINLRFWLKERKQLQLTDTEERAVLAELHEESQTDITKESKDEDEIDIFEDDEMTRNRNAKGKSPASTLLKILDPKTMQGKIIAFIMQSSTSVNDVCDNFFIERHALLTQLNVISRTAGIGYSVAGDKISLVLPDGVKDPFVDDLFG